MVCSSDMVGRRQSLCPARPVHVVPARHSTQLLGPVIDGYMRNTPEALRFVDTAAKQGVGAAITARDRPFGDYSQAPAARQPKREHVIRPHRRRK